MPCQFIQKSVCTIANKYLWACIEPVWIIKVLGVVLGCSLMKINKLLFFFLTIPLRTYAI
jgi:hypothetical protein